ncbi:hypothetical protein EAF04_009135 [Stromatinia cepivora]|nr:hypothetical protein EAF04_009135 [Stromatinia cepivora]
MDDSNKLPEASNSLGSNISTASSNPPHSQSNGATHQTLVTVSTLPATSFTKFVDLCPELKVNILKLAAQDVSRVIEITRNGVCKGQTPALFAVNRLTRAVVSKMYETLRPGSSQPIYFNPDNDTLLWHIDISSRSSRDELLTLRRSNRSLKEISADVGKWIDSGTIKSFAIKPVFGSPVENISQVYNDLMLWILVLYLHHLIPFWKGFVRFIVVSSSFCNLEQLRRFFDPEAPPGWYSWLRTRSGAPNKYPFPIPTDYEEEAAFYSRFPMANNN